jgi:LacI family transcriptional regulator
MVTSRDVARVAGVSQATVSRVLSGSDRVGDQTRQRVLDALSSTGYVPNAAARAMRTKRTGSIGVVVSRITNPFYPELLQALGTRLRAVDQQMVLWDAETAGEQSAVDAIRQRIVDGVVFTTAVPGSPALVEALRQGAPIVLVNRSVEGLAADQITSDNVAGGQHVARYFAANGHRACALLCGPRGVSTSDEREAGFRRGLEEAGIALSPHCVVRGDFSHDHGFRALEHLLGEDAPTAVFCVNDLVAFGAADAARRHGLSVPRDVWLVGYDDITMSSWPAYDLTTVRQPKPEIASLAVNWLLERIERPDLPPRSHRFPAELVVRGSTDGATA